MNDKYIEKKRYDSRAKKLLDRKEFFFTNKVPEYLCLPDKYYFELFRKKINKSLKILEIGSGIGEKTIHLLNMSFKVCATDLSPASVKLMKKRFAKYKNFSSRVADMEKLPFKKSSFDVICSSGSLSYGDNNLVMNEIFRVLRVDGILIIQDSLNNNPIYKFNRYLNYLLGKRSKSTIKRIPDKNLIDKYIKKFGYGKVKYFGSITWSFPLLNKILSEKFITKLSKWYDKKFNIKKSAFKFVLMLRKKNKE